MLGSLQDCLKYEKKSCICIHRITKRTRQNQKSHHRKSHCSSVYIAEYRLYLSVCLAVHPSLKYSIETPTVSIISAGWCVIINNVDFFVEGDTAQPMPKRTGSDKDAGELSELEIH